MAQYMYHQDILVSAMLNAFTTMSDNGALHVPRHSSVYNMKHTTTMSDNGALHVPRHSRV